MAKKIEGVYGPPTDTSGFTVGHTVGNCGVVRIEYRDVNFGLYDVYKLGQQVEELAVSLNALYVAEVVYFDEDGVA